MTLFYVFRQQIQSLLRGHKSFEGGSDKDKTRSVNKQDVDAVPKQCTSSGVVPYP